MVYFSTTPGVPIPLPVPKNLNGTRAALFWLLRRQKIGAGNTTTDSGLPLQISSRHARQAATHQLKLVRGKAEAAPQSLSQDGERWHSVLMEDNFIFKT
jgi:hypothetical protein